MTNSLQLMEFNIMSQMKSKMIYLFNMEAQNIFNSQVVWGFIILVIIISTLTVFLINIILKHIELKKNCLQSTKTPSRINNLSNTKTKNRIKNGKI